MRLVRISPAERVYYGASRSMGRAHAGVDTIDVEPQALLGGTVVFVGSDPGGYYNYCDIYQPGTNVVERLAELDVLNFDEGETVPQGAVVGRGTSNTGVTHREIRRYSGSITSYSPSFGINLTEDWLEYAVDTELFSQNVKRLEPTIVNTPRNVDLTLRKYQLSLLRGVNFSNDFDAVVLLQTKLKQLGYFLGAFGSAGDGIDGDFGRLTDSAVRDFQKSKKLIENGVVSAGTWGKLLEAVP
jgi:murein DD-endopeptidase MepM/ murein hydrolase activator NlpD